MENKNEGIDVGDEILIQVMVSDDEGNPMVRWEKVVVKGFPLHEYYPSIIGYKKLI